MDEATLRRRVNALVRNNDRFELMVAALTGSNVNDAHAKLRYVLVGASLASLRSPFNPGNSHHVALLLNVCGEVAQRLIKEAK